MARSHDWKVSRGIERCATCKATHDDLLDDLPCAGRPLTVRQRQAQRENARGVAYHKAAAKHYRRPNFAKQQAEAWERCIERIAKEPPIPFADRKKGEEACEHEWGSCVQYEGQKHSCAVIKGHKVAQQRHVCGSCMAQKKRSPDDDVEADDDA